MGNLLFTIFVSFLAFAISSQPPLQSIEDGVLDKIQLFAQRLDNPSNLAVVIKPFDASSADLGTGSEGGKGARKEEAQTMQSEGPRVLGDRFVATLQKLGPFKSARVLKAEEATPDGTLVIEGQFVAIDPGSRAKRYFAGFGAGKSSVKVTGVVKDSSGRTLAIFEQRRIGTMGMGGGDSLGKLMSDTRAIGEDIAKFLSKWARGENLE
jgi:hypothetical protein